MKRFIVPLSIAGLIGLGAFIWGLPTGSGEYRDSPDGCYTAWANNMTRGTFTGRIHYVELRVETIETGKLIWRIERTLGSTEEVSDFGDRSKRWIDWSADSSSVTIALSEKQKLVVPVQ